MIGTLFAINAEWRIFVFTCKFVNTRKDEYPISRLYSRKDKYFMIIRINFMILTQALSAVQLSVEFVTGFFYLFVFSIFSSIIFFLPLKLSSLFRLINWYPLYSLTSIQSHLIYFSYRPSLYRDSAAGPAEWFGSNAASCTCSSLPSLKRIDKFHSLLIYSIHIGQHLHSFCFGNFRKVLPSLHSMKFSPMYLYLHNSLTHQYMFTILLPLIMGSILIISALYRGSLIQHGTAWTV